MNKAENKSNLKNPRINYSIIISYISNVFVSISLLIRGRKETVCPAVVETKIVMGPW